MIRQAICIFEIVDADTHVEDKPTIIDNIVKDIVFQVSKKPCRLYNQRNMLEHFIKINTINGWEHLIMKKYMFYYLQKDYKYLNDTKLIYDIDYNNADYTHIIEINGKSYGIYKDDNKIVGVLFSPI